MRWRLSGSEVSLVYRSSFGSAVTPSPRLFISYYKCISCGLPEPPVLKGEAHMSQTVIQGGSAMLDCPVHGDPSPILRWLRNGMPLQRLVRMQTLHNGSLVIYSITVNILHPIEHRVQTSLTKLLRFSSSPASCSKCFRLYSEAGLYFLSLICSHLRWRNSVRLSCTVMPSPKSDWVQPQRLTALATEGRNEQSCMFSASPLWAVTSLCSVSAAVIAQPAAEAFSQMDDCPSHRAL